MPRHGALGVAHLRPALECADPRPPDRPANRTAPLAATRNQRRHCCPVLTLLSRPRRKNGASSHAPRSPRLHEKSTPGRGGPSPGRAAAYSICATLSSAPLTTRPPPAAHSRPPPPPRAVVTAHRQLRSKKPTRSAPVEHGHPPPVRTQLLLPSCKQGIATGDAPRQVFALSDQHYCPRPRGADFGQSCPLKPGGLHGPRALELGECPTRRAHGSPRRHAPSSGPQLGPPRGNQPRGYVDVLSFAAFTGESSLSSSRSCGRRPVRVVLRIPADTYSNHRAWTWRPRTRPPVPPQEQCAWTHWRRRAKQQAWRWNYPSLARAPRRAATGRFRFMTVMMRWDAIASLYMQSQGW